MAFLSTNASPAMAPWGGRKKTVGTNPWSLAAPAGLFIGGSAGEAAAQA